MACRPAPGKVDPALAKEQDRPMMVLVAVSR